MIFFIFFNLLFFRLLAIVVCRHANNIKLSQRAHGTTIHKTYAYMNMAKTTMVTKYTR